MNGNGNGNGVGDTTPIEPGTAASTDPAINPAIDPATDPATGLATDGIGGLFSDPADRATGPATVATGGLFSDPERRTGDRAASRDPERRHARFGTILWGVILLIFAAFMVTNALVPFSLDAGTWLIVTLVAGGVVLVIAGIAAALRRTD